jgi:ABC-type transport system involved in multi-copper enzyme maturation permease subunit
MKRIWYLAALTFREGIRDRAMFGVMGIALLLFLATIAIVSMYGYDLMKVTIDLNLSVVAFTGLLLCFFININLIAKDIDKRTIYCVLSKPISRSEYILGKYAGTLSLIIASILLLSTFGGIMISVIRATLPAAYFKDFTWLCYVQAVTYEIMMFVVLNAVIVFFSSFTSSSFLTLLYSIGIYVAGQSIEEVVQFLEKIWGTANHTTKFFWYGLQYIFPNLSAFDIKVLTSHGIIMSASQTTWLFLYSILYAAILLYFAALIFSKRELQ